MVGTLTNAEFEYVINFIFQYPQRAHPSPTATFLLLQYFKMKLSAAVYILNLGFVADTDFNGLHRVSRAANSRKLNLFDTELADVGNNGSPASAFPLSACQGDCDDDNDCEVSVFLPSHHMQFRTNAFSSKVG